MNFTDLIVTAQSTTSQLRTATQLCDFIKPTTTAEEFSDELAKYPDFKLNYGGQLGYTVLAQAAYKGNAALIEHIVNLGDKTLFFIGTYSYHSPLHCACSCENVDAGYLAAKKLVQLGAPINIVHEYWCENEDGVEEVHFFNTPLEHALSKGCIKITAMLLRIGGIVPKITEKKLATYESAKKELMTKQEMLFKAQTNDTQELPREVANYILAISAKLI